MCIGRRKIVGQVLVSMTQVNASRMTKGRQSSVYSAPVSSTSRNIPRAVVLEAARWMASRVRGHEHCSITDSEGTRSCTFDFTK